MSNYQPKPGSGSIFKNERKEKESQPDYRGEILTPEGQALEISLWVKEGKKGKFFSASVKPKQERGTKPQPAATYDPNDDIPF